MSNPFKNVGGHLHGLGFTPKKLFSNGEAGVWYDPSDVEASLTWRRNLLEYTESFDNSYYTGYFQKPNFTTGQADPLGGYNAMKWNASTTTGSSDGAKGGFYRDDSGGVIKPNTDYTVSVWLKATAPIVVSIGLMDGSSQIVNVTTSWQRFSVTQQKSTNPIHQPRLIQIIDYTNADVDIYIFGAQTEEGSTATEYQPIRTTFDNAFKQAFPKHTLYQDTNGIAPVTGLGQAVGIMLDKSEGLQFGDEKVVNGTFDNNINGWTVPSGSASTITHSDGALSAVRNNEDVAVATLSSSVVAGKTYRLEFDVVSKNPASGWVYFVIGTNFTEQNSVYGKSLGKKIYTFVANNNTSDIYLRAGGVSPLSFVVDNISLKEVKGSHATQSDSTKRPVFARHPERGRVNLLKYTEEFDNGYWTKLVSATVTANAGVAPNGTQTADRISLAADPISRVERNLPVENNKQLIFSIYLKSESGNKSVRIGVSTYSQLQTVTVTETWQRFTFAFTETDGVAYPRIQNTSSTAQDILAWGAQVEYANEATGYQKVVDEYDITESGYKSVYYLQFDGINDTMTVQPVTSTNAPISVFMGHDTEGNTSTSGYFLDIQDGRFLLAGAGYYTTASNWQNGTNIDATAKGVSTVVSDGTNANYRRDGIVERTGALANVSIQGAITIFSRYDYTTQLTNGNMYQLVIRGATSTDKEIDQAEEFVAIKTGLKSEVVGLATLDLNFGANTYTARNSNGSVL
jgi:hypothetical protein